MKTIEVVAGVIKDGNKIFATQRGYGDFKGGWEFPGGKMEPGETPQQALARELKEELTVDVSVEDFICTVDYDYPNFHLTMHCFYCTVINGELKLLEHEAAKWLEKENIRSVDWLPADIAVVEALEKN
ncbi:8-oxo-dGTP diphosphatase [Fibrobacter sp. UWH5]|uniref:(deoxy)nucleoside triphosphate pyrophosphohydrolase n=1 Tax=Fibrobacter sp. UWH5 TaxID=1896211 RepID=UPI0009226775|nr:(deoxy)nucleoside triphosphate pyrophosphohydrolase [Fibrobacter sp. UWH5]SHL89702.1 8-oxo-dGTP diphosphatase [Fibrobacter sp. UWH5]